MFPQLERELLKRLIDAEVAGKPLTYAQCARWIQGSTWEDLWADGMITIAGQGFVATATPDSKVVATENGKQYFKTIKS